MFNVRDFFDIENGDVVINEHILNISFLRAVKDAYKDPLPAFRYLRYRYDLKGPFSDVPEDEKDTVLLAEFPGEYTLEDPVMIEAIKRIDETITPTQRYYLDSKILMEKVGKYGRETVISAGRDGNISALMGQLKGVGRTIVEFRQLEKIVEQELEDMAKTKNRGNQTSGYDE